VALGEPPYFQQTLTVSISDPLILHVEVSRGDVRITYNREGQVTIFAQALDGNGKDVSEAFFKDVLTVEQVENQITVRDRPNPAYSALPLRISYKLDVPNRTDLSSTISGTGKQTVMGITGPARLVTGSGDIEAAYVSLGPVQAETGSGRISCTRVARVEAETGSGDITLMEDGPSKATVRKGSGKIEVGGARGAFEGRTDTGELHIKAALWDDWQLNSNSGTIRIELPPRTRFDIDAATKQGDVQVRRTDMDKPGATVREYRQKVNGGGKRIQVRTDNGNISLE
jgi:hypothetical protein